MFNLIQHRSSIWLQNQKLEEHDLSKGSHFYRCWFLQSSLFWVGYHFQCKEKITRGFRNLNHCSCSGSKSLRHVRLFPSLWAAAHQVPLSMEFSRQEYWSGLPFPSPGGSCQTRDWTCVSRIGRQILYHWATWEA